MSLSRLIRGGAVKAAVGAVPAGDTVHSDPSSWIDISDVAAVKLVNTVIGDLWLVRDDRALVDHPDIVRSGLPVLFFDEIDRLQSKTPAELAAIGIVKRTFPTGRILQ